MAISKLRVLLAFLLAPMIVPIVVSVFGFLLQRGLYTEFYLKIGAIVGYGFALFIGVPFYFVVIKPVEDVTFRPFVFATCFFQVRFY